ncbi:hypothetical protein ACTXT7_012287 [Hymenolepis weldensis]
MFKVVTTSTPSQPSQREIEMWQAKHREVIDTGQGRKRLIFARAYVSLLDRGVKRGQGGEKEMDNLIAVPKIPTLTPLSSPLLLTN